MERPANRDQVEQQLTSALKMVVDGLSEIGFEDFYILGKVNLILQGFIDTEGDFTDEYKALAKQAIDERSNQPSSIIVPGNEGGEISSIIIPGKL